MTAEAKNVQNVSDKITSDTLYMCWLRSVLFRHVERYDKNTWEMFIQVQPTMVSLTESLGKSLIESSIDTH
jgi:hypothetical protein